MKRIEIIAMREDGGQIIDRLQRRGCVEICDISDEALVKQSTASAVAEFEKRRGEAENALAVLENYSEKKPSILDQLNGKRELTDKEYSEDVKRCENTKKQVRLINELNKEISDLKGDIAKLRLKADGLIPWKELDIPTKGAETDFTANFIGTLPLKWEQDTLCEIGLKADTVEEGVDSLIAEVRKMNEELNIPKSFKDAGVDEKEFLAKVDLLADRAFEDQCTTANPRVPLVSEIKQILLDSYYGK